MQIVRQEIQRAGRTGFEPVLQAPEARVLSRLDYRPNNTASVINFFSWSFITTKKFFLSLLEMRKSHPFQLLSKFNDDLTQASTSSFNLKI
jgi:hypothetical protein